MNEDRSLLGMTGLCLADVLALLRLRPDLGGLARDVAAPHSWVARVGADGAAVSLAGAALWSLALWLGLGLFAAAATGLPGGFGALARALARVVLPAALYRVAVGSAGLGVLLAPVAAGAAPAAATSRGAVLNPVPTIPAPSWPTSPPASAGPRSASGVVVVRPGDSLWRIAAARLGPSAAPVQIAAAWPRWYAANRAVIGPDPDLIRPGQRLQAPAEAGS